MASFDSMYRRQPSLFSLESIELSELLSVGRDDFYRLIEQSPWLGITPVSLSRIRARR